MVRRRLFDDIELREVPVGIARQGKRHERDDNGKVAVPADRYWGARTQRVLNRPASEPITMPATLYRAFGHVKRGAAMVNCETGRLPAWKAEVIIQAADDLSGGRLDGHFPLTIYHSGTGEELDLNVNEVLANRAIQLLGGRIGADEPVHPIRDVGMGYGPLDAFTAASRLATVVTIEGDLVPKVRALVRSIEAATAGARNGMAITPRPGAAWPEVKHRLVSALRALDQSEGAVHEVSVGMDRGSAGDDDRSNAEGIAKAIAASTGKPFVAEPGASQAPTSLIPMTIVMAALRALADATISIVAFSIVGAPPSPSRVERPCKPELRLQSQASVHIAHARFGADEAVLAAAIAADAAQAPIRACAIASVLHAIQLLTGTCDALRRLPLDVS